MSKSIYSIRYNKLVEHYLNNKYDMYNEKHHIIPKCLGGSDDANNIVTLPARAHYILHYLLTKMHPDEPKILYAFWAMSMRKDGQEREYINSRRFSLMRESLSKASKLNNTGRKHTEESKKKMSSARKGKKFSEVHYTNLVCAAKNNLKKATESNLKRKEKKGYYFDAETRERLSEVNKRPKTEKEKGKMSKSAKNSPRKVTCIKCRKTMRTGHYVRWHDHI